MAQSSVTEKVRQASQNVVERLSWHTASRDQAGLARDLADGKDIGEIYPLGDATLVDEFLFFLEKIGITALLPALDPHRTQRATNVCFLSALLIYLLRVMLGLRFFWHIESVLLHSFTLMRLVGFNARQIRDAPPGGSCARRAALTSIQNRPKRRHLLSVRHFHHPNPAAAGHRHGICSRASRPLNHHLVVHGSRNQQVAPKLSQQFESPQACKPNERRSVAHHLCRLHRSSFAVSASSSYSRRS